MLILPTRLGEDPKKLSGKLGVPNDHVIISPGNHDLNQNANIGNELDIFEQLCATEGFVYSRRTTPSVLEVKGIPIIAFNTCLGGTEHALHGGLSKEYWKNESDMLTNREEEFEKEGLSQNIDSKLDYQVTAMDIPAMGFRQLDLCSEELLKYLGDCSVVLLHHNPIPTPNVDIRPYANLIDSGLLISHLMQLKPYVILLHGHTHCWVDISMNSNEGNQESIAFIGSRMLNQAASLIELTVNNQSDFLKADICHIERNGATYVNTFKYPLGRQFSSSIEDIDRGLACIPRNKVLTFTEISKLLGRAADESLAEELLKLEHRRVQISGKNQHQQNWRITLI